MSIALSGDWCSLDCCVTSSRGEAANLGDTFLDRSMDTRLDVSSWALSSYPDTLDIEVLSGAPLPTFIR